MSLIFLKPVAPNHHLDDGFQAFSDGDPDVEILGCPRKLGSMVSKWIVTYL